MNKISRVIIAGLMAGATAAMADVTVSFPVTDTVLRNLKILTLDFTVDGSGNVALDAQASNANAAPQLVVNAWDGAVGTLTDPSLFNTTFSLTATAGGIGTSVSTQSGLGQGIGIAAGGSALLQESGTESMVWTYSGPGTLNLKTLSYVRYNNADSNFQLVDSDTTTTYMMPDTSTTGDFDLIGAGFSIVDGGTWTIQTDPTKHIDAGGLVGGFSFDVIPEPATFGLIAAFGGGILFIRRRFMM